MPLTYLRRAFSVAWSEKLRGVLEIAGKIHNPRIVLYHQSCDLHAKDDETPWCSAFVNWCVQQIGLKGTRSAAAISWRSWGQHLARPVIGCIVVFAHHVGFYAGENETHVFVLGGNQGDTISVAAFRKSGVLDYRWTLGALPDADAETSVTAEVVVGGKTT